MEGNSVFIILAAAAAKSLQSCPTLRPRPCDSPGKNTGVSCRFLLQCMKVKVKSDMLSRARLLGTPWTAAYQAPPSMGFSRQECWSGVPLPSPYHPGEQDNNKSFLCPKRYFLHLSRLFTIQIPLKKCLGTKAINGFAHKIYRNEKNQWRNISLYPCIKTPHWLFIIYWINSSSCHINRYLFIACY